MRVFIFIGSLLFFSSVIGLFQVKSYVQDMNKTLVKIQKNINKTNSEINLLEAEWSYLNRPDRLEELAQKYLKHNNIILAQQIYNSIDSLQNSKSMVAQNIE